MARHRDRNWILGGIETRIGGSSQVPHDDKSLAVLMDIRDELKRLNSLLHCHNTVAIPALLRRIATNTTKRKVKKRS